MGRRSAVAGGDAPVDVVCPFESHRGSDFTLTRWGSKSGSDGAGQRWRCTGEDGGVHYFTAGSAPEVSVDRRKKNHGIVCTERGHQDGSVQSKGSVTTGTGTWQRYLCVRPNGDSHSFRVLVGSDGSVLTTLAKPPECKEHPGSKVTRNGSYGKGQRRRQRYRCQPEKDKAHYFTPALSRAFVDVGSEACATCDELLSPHRGVLTAARHTPWPLKGIVQALNDLSLGDSYSSVSLALRAHRDKAWAHLSSAHGIEVALVSEPVAGGSGSWTAKEGKGAWHLAADLVEQYAPLLWADTRAPIELRERKQREANDAALAVNPDAALATPIVYLLDELPVEFRRSGKNAGRFQLSSWSLLVVVEVLWHKGRDTGDLPTREARLRLARAYPRGNAEAWRLVLSDLPVRPDFVVADTSDAILNAVNLHYGQGVVPVIPSFFHIHRNIRDMLMRLPGTTTSRKGRTVLVDQLNKHLDAINRDEVLNLTDAAWTAWWEELGNLVASLGAPTAKVAGQRDRYKDRVAQALPILRKQPHLPASNAAVESRIRLTLEPFLTNRKHRYRNLARTNFLCDLATARAQAAFTDLDHVASVIRKSNESARGWAPAPRTLADTQPLAANAEAKKKAPVYSSLLNPLLLPALTKQRGLPATPPKPPRKSTYKPTGNPRGRPKGSRNKPKQATP